LAACAGVIKGQLTALFEQSYYNLVSGAVYEDEVIEVKKEA